MRKTILLIFCVCALICISSSQKLGTSLKNITESDKNKPKRKEVNPITKDIRKYLRECGANVSDEDTEENTHDRDEEDSEKQTTSSMKNNRGSYPNNFGGKNRGTYPTSYGSANKGGDDDCEGEEEEESEERDNSRRNGNRGMKKMMYKRSKDVETFLVPEVEGLERYKNRDDNRRGGGGKKRKKNDDYDDSEEEDDDDDDGCEDRSKNRRGNKRNNNRNKNNRNKNNNRGGNNRRGGYSFGGGYGSGEDHFGMDPYGNRYGGGYGGGEFGLYDGWGMYGGRLVRVKNDSEIESLSRKRRGAEYDEEREPDDVQCLSQCVFGYLEMLDDNRVPSETEVIKYLQDKIPNSSTRMKTIREARRCFAKLAITDTENGCQFSKSLAQCMKLEIEDKS